MQINGTKGIQQLTWLTQMKTGRLYDVTSSKEMLTLDALMACSKQQA